MRVAEIYLINAEAKAHLNDPDAINKLNDLKTARGAKPFIQIFHNRIYWKLFG